MKSISTSAGSLNFLAILLVLLFATGCEFLQGTLKSHSLDGRSEIDNTDTRNQCLAEGASRNLSVQAVEADLSRVDCDLSRYFSCNYISYSPEIASSSDRVVECFTSDNGSEQCLDVGRAFVSTAADRDAGLKAEVSEEYTCFHHEIPGRFSLRKLGSASHLKEAFEQAQIKCQALKAGRES